MEVIKLRDVGKQYLISHEKEALIRYLLPRFLRIKHYEKFWALKDISLNIEEGETLAILGRNGAGKTTLLNILAGITLPTEGSVEIKGKVSALLTLGAGFHPELTGEENIYLNASILGLSIQQTRKRFERIVDFSELGDFINAPLKTYSSGMYMRLGFAIATNVDFDILLIDELLTVGDIYFQVKCLDKLKKFKELGKTIIITSQSLNLINELCNRAILLDKGKIIREGPAQQVTNFYQKLLGNNKDSFVIERTSSKCLSLLEQKQSKERKSQEIKVSQNGWGSKSGTREVEIIEVKLINGKGNETNTFLTGEKMSVNVRYVVHKEVEDPHFGVAIFREDGTYCYGPNTRFDGLKIAKLRKGKGYFAIHYKQLNLLPGEYRISVAIWEREEKFAYDYHYAVYSLKVISDKNDHGVVYLKHRWKLKIP
jgi:ABC-type polysaccharide/polyol phosphate transport system ATPase subunit